MPHRNSKDVNRYWEKELAEYDRESNRVEQEFREHHMVISGGKNENLEDEEKEILELVLNGVSCSEIASQCGVETNVIIGLLEIIRAKLALPE